MNEVCSFKYTNIYTAAATKASVVVVVVLAVYIGYGYRVRSTQHQEYHIVFTRWFKYDRDKL